MKTPDVRDAIELIHSAVESTGQMQEMLKKPGIVEALEVIGCDIDARPKNQPMFEDITPNIVSIQREPQCITVEFDAGAADDVAAFVAAEQQCCSDVMFSMRAGTSTVMQVRATAELLDMVEGWMTQAHGSPPTS